MSQIRDEHGRLGLSRFNAIVHAIVRYCTITMCNVQHCSHCLSQTPQHMVRIQEGIYNKLSISLQDENDQLVQFDDKTLTVE